jgi:LPXTG-motif cell wall-anchored protein
MTPAIHRAWPAAATIASVFGLAIALYHYFTPMTGVTGASGALLVVVSTLLVLLLGIVWLVRRRNTRLTRVLIVIGAIGTMAAAWFLHEFWLVAAMAVVLLAVIVDLATADGGAR